jgi:integral membrane protein
MFNSALKRFRIISIIEGISYLLLVFIAMPIKYIGENPYPVKILGMAHGVLFILFMISLFEAKRKESWDTGFMFQLFVLSLIPFGAVVIESKVKPKEEKN